MTDPQHRPRYTGIATFFRTSYARSFAEADIRVSTGTPEAGGIAALNGASILYEILCVTAEAFRLRTTAAG